MARWPASLCLAADGKPNHGVHGGLAEGGGSRTLHPTMWDDAVLKTGRATGPVPPPKGASVLAYWIRLRRMATATALARSAAPSLRKLRRRRSFTVSTDWCVRSAIS